MTLSFEALGNFIHGRFIQPKPSHGDLLSYNPGNLELAPLVFPYHYDQVNQSIESNVQTALSLGSLSFDDRANYLKKLIKAIEEHRPRIAFFCSYELGMTDTDSQEEVSQSLYYLQAYVTHLEENNIAYRSLLQNTRPLGPCVFIAPALQPFLKSVKVLSATLMAGCPITLKSSRYSPFVGQVLSEILSKLEIPKGLINLVHGDEEVSKRLCGHPDVKGILYSGPFETSIQIRKNIAADYQKKMIVETGGKNTTVLWEETRLDAILPSLLHACFSVSGQLMQNCHRVVVHESIFESFIELFHRAAKKLKVGYFQNSDNVSQLGPLLSENALENYVRFQGIALREGCQEIMRGKALERDEKGYYVSPSIHLVPKIDKKSTYQKTEVFGPNVAIYKTSALEEVLQILQLSQYGYVMSIYGKDEAIYPSLLEKSQHGILLKNLPTTTWLSGSYLGHLKSGNYHLWGYGLFNELRISFMQMETAPHPLALQV